MSLDQEELRRTRQELRANFELSGLTGAEVDADLGFGPDRLDNVLGLAGDHTPEEVWLLRDYLDQAIRDQGRDPVPFTVLTEQSRVRARSWFSLRPAPHHDFAPRRPARTPCARRSVPKNSGPRSRTTCVPSASSRSPS